MPENAEAIMHLWDAMDRLSLAEALPVEIHVSAVYDHEELAQLDEIERSTYAREELGPWVMIVEVVAWQPVPDGGRVPHVLSACESVSASVGSSDWDLVEDRLVAMLLTEYAEQTINGLITLMSGERP